MKRRLWLLLLRVLGLKEIAFASVAGNVYILYPPRFGESFVRAMVHYHTCPERPTAPWKT